MVLPLHSPSSAAPTTITEFDTEAAKSTPWRITNDGVMGGLSKGEVSYTDAGTMVFKGTLSLENNGGFSTARMDTSADLGSSDGVALRVKGDGRTYQMRLATDAKYRSSWEVSFSADIGTKKGQWTEVRVPFSDFKAGWRGRSLDDVKFDPSKIRRVGILLGDKKPGKFKVEIDWIRPYSDKSSGTLVDAVANNKDFKTLGAALRAAGLLDTLKGEGPFTVFAPTDAAFAKLPDGTVEELLKPENIDRLKAVLTYHVFAGKGSLADALKAETLPTVQGDSIQVAFTDGKVRVNESTLVNADLACSNGLIHVIDSVLLPSEPKAKTILETAVAAGSFKTLAAAVKAAGLTDVIESDGPFTIFAPTDAAFAALPKGTLESLLKSENIEQLQSILTYHAVSGRVGAGDALKAAKATTVNGRDITFAVRDGKFQVNQATIRTTDIECANGVIHVIDAVLLPPATGKGEGEGEGEKSEQAKASSPRQLIELAIDRGVPLYNDGDVAQCADIYEQCIKMIASDCGSSEQLKTSLNKVLAKATHTGSADAKAWMLRHTLDATYAYLQQR